MPKRELTNAVNWLLDNAIPPFLRDSKIFMSPFMRMILGKKYTYYMKFKDDLSTLTDMEIDEYYNILSDTFINRETDLAKSSVEFILQNISGTKIADIGCGKGYLAKKIKALPVDQVFACDITSENKIEDGINYVRANITSLPFADKQFDTVICAHTIEHIRDISKAITELRRVCKDKLIIVVPRQREYRYTFDLHIHFFPYIFSLQKLMNSSDCEFILRNNDIICLENQRKK